MATTAAPTHHRKIDLQSAADLAFLQRNIRAAARQKIDLHFPPSAAQVDGKGGGDSLRRGVEDIVQTGREEEEEEEEEKEEGRNGKVSWRDSRQLRKRRDVKARPPSAALPFAPAPLSLPPPPRRDLRLDAQFVEKAPTPSPHPQCPPRTKTRKQEAANPSAAPTQFIAQTLAHARRNITINGLDLPPPSRKPTSTRSRTVDGIEVAEEEEEQGVEYEAYDARLASKLQSLYLALESETMAVARLRREAPRRAAEGWRARFWEGGDVQGEGVGGLEDGEKMEVDSEEVVLGGAGMGMGMEGLEERWEGVRDMYAVACEGLVGLKAGMTETVGRCERAGRVVAEVERG